MNLTNLHLMISHLPIFGSLLGTLVLAFGIWNKNNLLIIAAFYLFIVASIGAAISYKTGEYAEQTVEKIQGIVIQSISFHKNFAKISILFFIVLALFSVIGAYLTLKNSPLIKTVSLFIFILSLISLLIIARTGYLGRKIRHTEIYSTIDYKRDGYDLQKENNNQQNKELEEDYWIKNDDDYKKYEQD